MNASQRVALNQAWHIVNDRRVHMLNAGRKIEACSAAEVLDEIEWLLEPWWVSIGAWWRFVLGAGEGPGEGWMHKRIPDPQSTVQVAKDTYPPCTCGSTNGVHDAHCAISLHVTIEQSQRTKLQSEHNEDNIMPGEIVWWDGMRVRKFPDGVVRHQPRPLYAAAARKMHVLADMLSDYSEKELVVALPGTAKYCAAQLRILATRFEGEVG